MNQVYLLIGGNIEPREEYLKSTLKWLENEVGELSKTSAVYETEPWGYLSQSPFLNQAVFLKTKLNLELLMDKSLRFQRQLNNQKNTKFGPRAIDIDLIFCGDQIIKTDNLMLPHPRLHERNFVLIPLAEIAADFEHPIFKKTVGQLLRDCLDTGKVRKYEPECP